jgi:broad specificity phosphatase PhoE
VGLSCKPTRTDGRRTAGERAHLYEQIVSLKLQEVSLGDWEDLHNKVISIVS